MKKMAPPSTRRTARKRSALAALLVVHASVAASALDVRRIYFSAGCHPTAQHSAELDRLRTLGVRELYALSDEGDAVAAAGCTAPSLDATPPAVGDAVVCADFQQLAAARKQLAITVWMGLAAEEPTEQESFLAFGIMDDFVDASCESIHGLAAALAAAAEKVAEAAERERREAAREAARGEMHAWSEARQRGEAEGAFEAPGGELDRDVGGAREAPIDLVATAEEACKFCLECGARLPRRAKFCIECGERQPAAHRPTV